MTAFLIRKFVPDHEKTTDTKVRTAYGKLSSVVSIVSNLLLFALKILAGILSASVAITADAFNNLSDAGAQIVSLVCFRIAAKPADREHPFGHARIEYVTSMIVSFLVMLVGFELLKSSFSQIFSPERPDSSPIAIIVLVGSMLCKLWLGLFNRTIGKRIDSSVMRATAADSLSDVFATGAVLVATVLPMIFTNMNWNPDAYMGVIVAVLIIVAGFRILNESKNAILGEAPSEEIVKQITETVDRYEGALGIHDMVVHNYGPGRIIASLHIEVDGSVDVFETHDMIDTIEKELRDVCGIEATIHMDPIVTDDEQVNELRAKTAEAVRKIHPSMQIHDFRFVAGATHTNLIFDVVLPFEVKMNEAEVKAAVAEKIKEIDPTYCVVLNVDRT